jgi:hypothetical protein
MTYLLEQMLDDILDKDKDTDEDERLMVRVTMLQDVQINKC